MKGIDRVKMSEKIVFGDPMYFEQMKGDELKSLTVDFKPPPGFDTKVILN